MIDESSPEVAQIVIILSDDYSDEFFGDNPGITKYEIELHLIERGSEED